MTTDQAARMADALATLKANGGNVKRTALQLGIPRTTLKTWRDKTSSMADIIPPETKQTYIDLWGQAETVCANRIISLAPLSENLRDVAFSGQVANRARYTEQHPEFQGNRTLIDQSKHVHLSTNAALEVLIKAQKQLASPGSPDTS